MRNLLIRLTMCACVVGVLGGWGGVARAQDTTAAIDAEADSDDPKDVQDKLLKWTNLEQAFLKAAQNRQLLARGIAQHEAKLKETTDEAEKTAIRKSIGDARKQLHNLSLAMDVVFGVGNRRDYEYNPIKSTVYLRVGTLQEAFAHTVKTRELLRKFVVEQNEKKEAEKDEKAREEVEQTLANAVRQYQIVAASLQTIFGVAPQRHYTYDPRNLTLYLNVSENEVETLKTKLTALQQEQEQAAPEGE